MNEQILNINKLVEHGMGIWEYSNIFSITVLSQKEKLTGREKNKLIKYIINFLESRMLSNYHHFYGDGLDVRGNDDSSLVAKLLITVFKEMKRNRISLFTLERFYGEELFHHDKLKSMLRQLGADK